MGVLFLLVSKYKAYVVLVHRSYVLVHIENQFLFTYANVWCFWAFNELQNIRSLSMDQGMSTVELSMGGRAVI